MFTKIKVILEENWLVLEEHLCEKLYSEQFLADFGMYM